jgi:hypothetical protein
MLNLGEHSEMVGLDEHIPAVLEGSQQIERFVEAVHNVPGRLLNRRLCTLWNGRGLHLREPKQILKAEYEGAHLGDWRA